MKLRIRKSSLRKTYIALYLFILIFEPPVIPHLGLLLAVLSGIGILARFPKSYRRVLHRSGQWQWIMTMVALLVYDMVLILVNDVLFGDMVQGEHYITQFNRFFVLVATLIPCATYLICYFDRHGYTAEDLINALINAAMLQVLCVFSALLIPPVHRLFLFFQRLYASDGLFYNQWFVERRSYGFASVLTDHFGFGMGILAGIALYHAIEKGKVGYAISSLLIAVAGTMCSRTAGVIYIIAVLATLVVNKGRRRKKLLLYGIPVAAALVVLLIGVFQLIDRFNPATFDWIVDEYAAALRILGGDSAAAARNAGSLAHLLTTERSWNLPEGFQLLFGSGHSIYGARGYGHSDVGYVNDLWLVGILGVSFMYGSLGNLLWKARRGSDETIRKCVPFFAAALLAFDVKGWVIGHNAGMMTILMLVFYSICHAGPRSGPDSIERY